MASRTISVYLLKNASGAFSAALRAPDDAIELPLRDDVARRGAVFLKESEDRTPEWAAFVAGATADAGLLEQLTTRSASAVVILEASRRRFALTFGYGRAMLDPEGYVRDFGLKVVLNRVEPASLRSVDAKTLEELTIYTRRQTSKGSGIMTFALDLRRDLVKAMAGTPSDPAFATRLAGADALSLTAVGLAPGNLAAKCREVYKAYQDDTYKQSFAWIDHLQRVTEPKELRRLDGRVIRELRKPGYSDAYLAPPEIIDWADSEFVHPDEDDRAADVDLATYLGSHDLDDLDLDVLREDRIGLYSAAAGQVIATWSVYRCLVLEIWERNNIHVLTGGDWFRVERAFADAILKTVESLPAATIAFPTAEKGEREEVYNARAAAALGPADAVNLDQVFFTATESQSKIELCDLLLAGRQLVHIKKKRGSSTLSHLWGQGAVSGDLLLSDPELRRQVNEHLTRERPVFAPLVEENPAIDPRDWEIVYGVISRPAAAGRKHFLPFFSQVHLAGVSERLVRAGYRVSLVRVDEGT